VAARATQVTDYLGSRMDFSKLWKRLFTEHPEEAIPWIILGFVFSIMLHSPFQLRLLH
jgi:hypothetical protein